ncbi:MAG: CapA family protein [Actinomycetota bacterium]|nr:CapA family protein [Actinomycetota bacterium]MDH5224131.1 CapA family protein [Actinomycetota bacterium]MDH5313221.1 CapA family protein [Actinomycetota bacterium]
MRARRITVATAVAVCVTLIPPMVGVPTAESSSAERRPRIVVAFTGDVLATRATWEAARRTAGSLSYDFRPMFRPLGTLIRSADLAICHLETPLTGHGVGLSDFPRYVVPHQLANAIGRAGYDGCSTASNHSLDGGLAGIRSTLRKLDSLGIGHTGTARSRREAARTARYRVGGAVVAHLSYAASFNGLEPRYAWEANRIDARRIVSKARRARRLGADVVVLSLHWGTEHRHAPTGVQRALARRLTASRAIDLIVGHHAHVIQPIRRIHWRTVAYGLGNSFSGMTASLFGPAVQDGMALLATFERGPRKWRVRRVRYAPTWVQPGRFVVRLVAPAIDANRLPPASIRELRRSWRRTVRTVDAAHLGVVPFRRGRL